MPSADPFVPVLTVMVDYGNAPFLWLNDSPVEDGIGGCICDGRDCCGPDLMSERLWRKFADWAIEFDRTCFYSADFDASGWDWIAYHSRGLQLARRLKEEVGDAYRVAYLKPLEDPNNLRDERREILGDGSIVLKPLRESPDTHHFCQAIISGGQTGVDRAALDFAIAHHIPHGGWAPRGREAEDGAIALKYQLTELAHGGYRQRNKRNVGDSDGTLIINTGKLDGGTLATQGFARQLSKPCFVAQLDEDELHNAAERVLSWVQEFGIKTMNVAGPRESKRPGIYRITMQLLDRMNECRA